MVIDTAHTRLRCVLIAENNGLTSRPSCDGIHTFKPALGCGSADRSYRGCDIASMPTLASDTAP